MRLRELDAQWICDANESTQTYGRRTDGTVEKAQGILFQCPKCSEGKERGQDERGGFVVGAHYISVCFSNPRGALVAPDVIAGGKPRWEIVSGTTLDDITLSPSINCDIPWKDKDGVTHPSSCKFYGYIRNGDAA